MELEDFYRIVLNDAIKDLNMIFLNDDCVEMQYKMKDEYAKDNFNTNVYVAAFTTSSARIRLYEIMDKLGDKVLYSDTDSIMYIDDGTNTIETGCMLGEWTDELEKDQYIQHWISPASKDYAYRLNNGKVKESGTNLFEHRFSAGIAHLDKWHPYKQEIKERIETVSKN
ncbi:DNA_pol_B_2 domain-containing protein [Trichonephila clavipes]|nr:DNA_pol_B_2 domain-containing protein [Trichonephila clavipes]